MSQEEWAPIEDFPGYEISTQGRVITTATDHIKVATQNQFHVPSVLLAKAGQYYRRSVPLLVASTFIPKPAKHFDTPINLNGDRMDNRVENLAWRPRWFAIRYHQQFSEDYIPAYSKPVQDAHTLQMYENTHHAAIENGLLDTEVWLAILNRTVTFPTNQKFQMVDV